MKTLEKPLASIYFIELKKLFFLFSPLTIFGQLGIGTENPNALLDIISDVSKSNKAIKITNNENNNIFNLYSNGNFEFFGALMTNNNAGNNEEYFVSNGNDTPVWKSIVPKDTKQLFEVFNANSIKNSTFQPINYWNRYVFENTNLVADPAIGIWNSSTNEFTVLKKGIYYVYAGVQIEMEPGIDPDSTSKMNLYLGSKTYQINAGTTWNSNVSNPIYYDNMNAEIVQLLDVNEKIKINVVNQYYKWKRTAGSIHIKYASL